MSNRVGATAVAVFAALGLAACSTSATTATTTTPTPPALVLAAPTITATTASQAPADAPLTCKQIKTASVGSKSIHYHGYTDSIPLGGGLWSGEDGNTVTLQPQCAIGDLDGDGAPDVIGVVELTNSGTGQFYTLVVWRNVNGKPVFTALADVGDRNPVQSVSIADGKATVIYLTRTSDAPMAEVNIKRTAVYQLSGHKFTQTSHHDAPYTQK